MSIVIIEKNITSANADVIVNAANGWGYMGGEKARQGLLKGVAESLNRATNGEMEKYCLKNSRKFEHITSVIFGTKAGKIYTSPAFGLNCKEVIHAVTMNAPASRSNIQTVEILVNSIFKYCMEKGHHTIAMPLLGTGTGGLDKNTVYSVIYNTAYLFPDLSINIYINTTVEDIWGLDVYNNSTTT